MKPKSKRIIEYVNELITAFNTKNSHPLTTISQTLIEPLSEREREVLHHIADGLTNREIGEHLYLTLNTVKIHTRNIYGKLGVKNRTQAVSKARDLGILSSS